MMLPHYTGNDALCAGPRSKIQKSVRVTDSQSKKIQEIKSQIPHINTTGKKDKRDKTVNIQHHISIS